MASSVCNVVMMAVLVIAVIPSLHISMTVADAHPDLLAQMAAAVEMWAIVLVDYHLSQLQCRCLRCQIQCESIAATHTCVTVVLLWTAQLTLH
jgi:hypothetical protein